jgi:hypothetical protein
MQLNLHPQAKGMWNWHNGLNKHKRVIRIKVKDQGKESLRRNRYVIFDRFGIRQFAYSPGPEGSGLGNVTLLSLWWIQLGGYKLRVNGVRAVCLLNDTLKKRKGEYQRAENQARSDIGLYKPQLLVFRIYIKRVNSKINGSISVFFSIIY